MKKIKIYNTREVCCDFKIDSSYKFKIWTPSLLNFLPPNKSFKYIIYWLFHYTRIFKNRNYSAIIVYKDKNLIASLLMVPKYYKWKYMKNNDIQFTYVLTEADYRGKKIAPLMINFGFNALRDKVDNFWYVTDNSNVSSMKVAEKLNFNVYDI